MTASGNDVAIVDYGAGNLFSIQQACRHVGLDAEITADGGRIEAARAVVLPGVGAFGDAMAELDRLGLVEVLREIGASNTPLVGICLGMQLLMSESTEFGRHQGLGLIAGTVKGFGPGGANRVKIPQIGWNRVFPGNGSGDAAAGWDGSLLSGLEDGEYMYFVHSYYVMVENSDVELAKTTYGGVEYCSALQQGSVFGCQFHPERSGPAGLTLYANMARAARSAA